MSVSVDCLLFDKAEGVYYRLLYGPDTTALLRGTSLDNMAAVACITISHYSDGGSLQAYTTDGYVINVPERRFEQDGQAQIARYGTRREHRQHVYEALSEFDREQLGPPAASADDDRPARYVVGH